MDSDNVTEVQRHLGTSSQMNRPYEYCGRKFTYLQIAIHMHAYSSAAYLLDHGAVVRDLPEDVGGLLAAFALQDSRKDNGEHHRAKMQLLRKVIEKGADLEAIGGDGQYVSTNKTPLMFYLENGFVDGANILIDAGVSLSPFPYLKDKRGKLNTIGPPRQLTPTDMFQLAIAGARKNLDGFVIADRLLSLGAKVCHQASYKRLPPFWEHGSERPDIVDLQRKFIKLSFDQGCANPDAVEARSGNNALWAFVKRPDLLDIPISFGVDVNGTNALGTTPMVKAVIERNLESMRILKKAGATLTFSHKYHCGNLIRVAASGPSKGRDAVIELLSEWGVPKDDSICVISE